MGMVFLSENACEPLISDLKQEGHEIFLVKSTDLTAEAIASHPDIYLCRVGETLIVDDAIRTEPDLRVMYDMEMEEKLGDASEAPLIPALQSESGGAILFQMGGIGPDYPDDVAYNAVSTGKYFIHNLQYTSPALLERARETGLEFIHVKQGYAKCSVVVVGDQAVITADRGIARSIEAYNQDLMEDGQEQDCIDCLLVEEGHVLLPGMNVGFLGGASGLIKNKLYFNGNLREHPDFEKITAFAEEHGAETVWYEEEPLTDIGSILYFDSVIRLNQ